MESFNIILKNERVKSYRSMALIILVVHIFLFIYLFFYDKYRMAAGSALVILFVYVLIQWNYVRKKKQQHFFNEFLFFILAFCWLGAEVYLLVAVCMVMGILYFLSLQKIEFIFNNEGVSKMNFPKREYEWSEFSNVILKDNLLTLDYNNNKIIQAELAPLQNIDEQKFNLFSKQCLNSIPTNNK